jgi:hypothetical protein
MLACLLAALIGGLGRPQSPAGPPPSGTAPQAGKDSGTSATPETAKRGLILTTKAACPGYTLFSPLNSTTTYLVDLAGELVHSWPSRYEPGQAVYLLDDGSVLRAGREPGSWHFGGGGLGGRVERIAPDGTVVWTYVCADEEHCQHHDIQPLPNGHVLLIAWEKKTRAEALAAGCDPENMPSDELWPDCVLEVAPEGTSGGKIVWEWHTWDHLIQQVDATKPNYGIVAEHPELVDLNYQRLAPRESSEEIQRLRALGYIGGAEPAGDESAGAPRQRPPGPAWGPGPGRVDMRADWCHTNAIDYNAKFDQIALSVHTFNEIWIIDHSTTTAEAASHRGGRCGRGGDLLYRWGNSRAYGTGGTDDQQLFAQHDVRWIPAGYPGEGHLTVFNNGPGRADGQYSSIVEIAPPVDGAGRYRLERGKAYGPAKPSWEYTAAEKSNFFSSHISGAQRLSNGNTLICAGEQACVFEVNAAGQTVWEYINPYDERSGPRGRMGPPGMSHGGPRMPGPRPGAARGDGPPSGRPWGPPPGGMPFGPPPGGPGGPPGGGGGGLFRATRVPANHAGVRALLAGKLAPHDDGE